MAADDGLGAVARSGGIEQFDLLTEGSVSCNNGVSCDVN